MSVGGHSGPYHPAGSTGAPDVGTGRATAAACATGRRTVGPSCGVKNPLARITARAICVA